MKIELFLENTLLELLRYKSIDSIHVKDIIKELGVCKGTFYKYYQDKYDLVVHAFEHKFYRVIEGDSWEEFVTESLKAFRSAPDTVYNAFLSHDINSIGNYHRMQVKRRILEQRAAKQLPVEGVEYAHAIDILTWLINHTTIAWLKAGCVESEEDVLKMIRRLMPVLLCDEE